MASVWSRRAMIISLGESGFSVFHAGHWSWQRPHSVQVAKSRTPFQLKSSAAPTPSLASSSRSSRSSRVSALPSLIIGLAAPRATGLAPEQDVQRRQEDVQVLGVEHEDQEHQHHADVQQQADALEHLQGPLADAVEQVAHPDRDERAALVGQVAEGRRGAPEQEHRPDDVEDHEQRQVRRAEVRAEEPGLAAEVLGRVPSRMPDERRIPKKAIIAMKSCRKPRSGQSPTIGIAQSSVPVVARGTAA